MGLEKTCPCEARMSPRLSMIEAFSVHLRLPLMVGFPFRKIDGFCHKEQMYWLLYNFSLIGDYQGQISCQHGLDESALDKSNEENGMDKLEASRSVDRCIVLTATIRAFSI